MASIDAFSLLLSTYFLGAGLLDVRLNFLWTCRVDATIHDFDLLRVLGEGSLSIVMEARWKSTGEIVALKIIDKFFIKRHNMISAVVRERAIMDAVRSELIVELLFTFQDDAKLYMGMELAPNGDLFEQLQARGPRLRKQEAQFYAAEMVLMLELLRRRNVVFRDFKPENMLLDGKGHLKLTDFGCARFVATAEDCQPDAQAAEAATAAHGSRPSPPSDDTTAGPSDDPASERDQDGEGSQGHSRLQQRPKRRISFVGTADYMAPEVLENEACGFEVDLWALGCVLYQMLAGTPPFRDQSEYLILQRVADNKFTFPDGFDIDAQDLISQLLLREPEQRLGASQITQLRGHAFFEGVEWSQIRQMDAPAFRTSSQRGASDVERWEMLSLQHTLPSKPSAHE